MMIQLIDQSNAIQGLVYRCLNCNAEFISAPPLLDFHHCGKPDVDEKRGIRPYVRPGKVAVEIRALDPLAAADYLDANVGKIAAVANAARKQRGVRRVKKTAETLAVTAPPENLDAKKPAPKGRRPKPGSSTPIDN